MTITVATIAKTTCKTEVTITRILGRFVIREPGLCQSFIPKTNDKTSGSQPKYYRHDGQDDGENENEINIIVRDMDCTFRNPNVGKEQNIGRQV